MEKPKVLVVDDDPGTCSLLEMALEIEEYRTASRKTIEKGDVISLLDQEQPHILVLDLHLGSEDALKYVGAIRTHPVWKDLLILATSAIDHRQECLKAGANDFILKPFDWTEIIKKIERLLNNSR